MKTWESYDIAMHKIKNWCAYQERSQHDARVKIQAYGLESDETEKMIAELIAENFLNEERFALAFAGGKFRIKHWGRYKIKAELKKHRVSDYCINKALASLNDEEYDQTIIRLIEKKGNGSKVSDARKQFYNTLNFLIARGFEAELVKKHLNQSFEEQTDELRS